MIDGVLHQAIECVNVGARGIEEGRDGGKKEILCRERGGERVREREGGRDREPERKTEKEERAHRRTVS